MLKILILQFFQVRCCFRRKGSNIRRPPSWTIHQMSMFPLTCKRKNVRENVLIKVLVQEEGKKHQEAPIVDDPPNVDVFLNLRDERKKMF